MSDRRTKSIILSLSIFILVFAAYFGIAFISNQARAFELMSQPFCSGEYNIPCDEDQDCAVGESCVYKPAVLKEWLLIVKGYCSNDNNLACRRDIECGGRCSNDSAISCTSPSDCAGYECAATNQCLANTQDAIGLRIMENVEPLPTLEWYSANAPNPSESVQEVSIDGYTGIVDGRTVYVAAINHDTDTNWNRIYTFVLSYSSDASDYTVRIFNQILQRWKFNTNVAEAGNCSTTTNIQCILDYQCPEGEYCTSPKSRLIRDFQRITDIGNIYNTITSHKSNLEGVCTRNTDISCKSDAQCPDEFEYCQRKPPQLQSGTYIPGYTISKWESWQSALGSTIGIEMPVDPINQFNGACKKNVTIGTTTVCLEPEPETCFDVQSRYDCTPDNSYVYKYVLNKLDPYLYEVRSNLETAAYRINQCDMFLEYFNWDIYLGNPDTNGCPKADLQQCS